MCDGTANVCWLPAERLAPYWASYVFPAIQTCQVVGSTSSVLPATLEQDIPCARATRTFAALRKAFGDEHFQAGPATFRRVQINGKERRVVPLTPEDSLEAYIHAGVRISAKLAQSLAEQAGQQSAGKKKDCIRHCADHPMTDEKVSDALTWAYEVATVHSAAACPKLHHVSDTTKALVENWFRQDKALCGASVITIAHLACGATFVVDAAESEDTLAALSEGRIRYVHLKHGRLVIDLPPSPLGGTEAPGQSLTVEIHDRAQKASPQAHQRPAAHRRDAPHAQLRGTHRPQLEYHVRLNGKPSEPGHGFSTVQFFLDKWKNGQALEEASEQAPAPMDPPEPLPRLRSEAQQKKPAAAAAAPANGRGDTGERAPSAQKRQRTEGDEAGSGGSGGRKARKGSHVLIGGWKVVLIPESPADALPAVPAASAPVASAPAEAVRSGDQRAQELHGPASAPAPPIPAPTLGPSAATAAALSSEAAPNPPVEAAPVQGGEAPPVCAAGSGEAGPLDDMPAPLDQTQAPAAAADAPEQTAGPSAQAHAGVSAEPVAADAHCAVKSQTPLQGCSPGSNPATSHTTGHSAQAVTPQRRAQGPEPPEGCDTAASPPPAQAAAVVTQGADTTAPSPDARPDAAVSSHDQNAGEGARPARTPPVPMAAAAVDPFAQAALPPAPVAAAARTCAPGASAQAATATAAATEKAGPSTAQWTGAAAGPAQQGSAFSEVVDLADDLAPIFRGGSLQGTTSEPAPAPKQEPEEKTHRGAQLKQCPDEKPDIELEDLGDHGTSGGPEPRHMADYTRFERELDLFNKEAESLQRQQMANLKMQALAQDDDTKAQLVALFQDLVQQYKSLKRPQRPTLR